ncbi:DUF1648 domain-containing protein [Hymenobacter negativus]|uniref:DUF1648 domain-containing protein n=1 Tax=Hymenobacter negativus TaxID=2795026 RepID=A0ABS0Q225_9BACT|nr:DUF1648 domain-containing protein [Hymenobacter negativus]MBH8556673.1 DUF1648 domain-containing protein [Hymenobacter negativus]
MEARPKIDVPQTAADHATELFAWSALVLLWGLTIWGLFTLPATIPVHFNGAGVPDHYGEKSSLLLLPLVATVLFAALTAAGKFPHVLNYPAEITPANALGQYREAIRLTRGLKIGMVLVFLLLVFQTGQTATGKTAGLGAWFMPVTLGLLFLLPGLWYWVTISRARA